MFTSLKQFFLFLVVVVWTIFICYWIYLVGRMVIDYNKKLDSIKQQLVCIESKLYENKHDTMIVCGKLVENVNE